MSDADLKSRIQTLLGADDSPQRAELTWLAFEALVSQPVSLLLSDPELVNITLSALTRDNTARVSERHVLPATSRIAAELQAGEQRLRDLLPEAARAELVRIVESGRGPRLPWLKGALDPADLRELFAPVLQRVLVQFASKLPIPGLSGATGSGGAAAGALGGLVGMLGKQVQKSASQFADVGKSVIGGLGSELERRMQALARDFSHTAMGELRTAVEERLKSPEGQAILLRMRDRAIGHVLDAKLSDVSKDFMRTPFDELSQVAPDIAAYHRDYPLLGALLRTELSAALSVLGQRSLADLLMEAGLYENARDLTLRIIDPGAKALFASDAFGAWLTRLLEAAKGP